MKTREEFEKQALKVSTDPTEFDYLNRKLFLLLEVLLDIRDLLGDGKDSRIIPH